MPDYSLCSWEGTVTIFVSCAGKLLELARSDLSPTSRTSILVYFDGVGCTGNPYMYASNDNIRALDNLHDDLYLYYGPTTGKFYARGNEVWEAPIKNFSYMSGGISICEDAGGVGQSFVSMNQIDLPFVLPLQNPAAS